MMCTNVLKSQNAHSAIPILVIILDELAGTYFPNMSSLHAFYAGPLYLRTSRRSSAYRRMPVQTDQNYLKYW